MKALTGKSVFVGKVKGKEFRRQGLLTPEGSGDFELARERLAKLVGWPPDSVSDGDTMEYLARGDKDTRAYLRSR